MTCMYIKQEIRMENNYALKTCWWVLIADLALTFATGQSLIHFSTK